MKCENCKINEDRVRWGYSEHDLECTCDTKQMAWRVFSDYFIAMPLIILLVGLALLVSPFFWLSDKIEEWSIKDSYDYK